MELSHDQADSPESKYSKALMLAAQCGLPNLRFYNGAGYSKERLDSILYELQKQLNISDVEKAEGLPAAVVQEEFVEKVLSVDLVVLQDQLKEAEEAAKSGFKIAILYPFIDDAATPDVLKVLVSDMMTAYRNFLLLHEELSVFIYGDADKGIEPKELTAEELFTLGGAVIEQWQLNELINEELRYYGEYKKVLGKHPKLQELLLAQKLDALEIAKYPELIKKAERNILSNKTKLKNAKSDAKREEIQFRIDAYETEKAAMLSRLGEADGSLAPVKELPSTGQELEELDVNAAEHVEAGEDQKATDSNDAAGN